MGEGEGEGGTGSYRREERRLVPSRKGLWKPGVLWEVIWEKGTASLGLSGTVEGDMVSFRGQPGMLSELSPRCPHCP